MHLPDSINFQEHQTLAVGFCYMWKLRKRKRNIIRSSFSHKFFEQCEKTHFVLYLFLPLRVYKCNKKEGKFLCIWGKIKRYIYLFNHETRKFWKKTYFHTKTWYFYILVISYFVYVSYKKYAEYTTLISHFYILHSQNILILNLWKFFKTLFHDMVGLHLTSYIDNFEQYHL